MNEEQPQVIINEAPPSGLAKFLSIVAWLATIAGAGIAILFLAGAMSADAAPAQAAAAAIACALVIVPYCVARAIDSLRK